MKRIEKIEEVLAEIETVIAYGYSSHKESFLLPECERYLKELEKKAEYFNTTRIIIQKLIYIDEKLVNGLWNPSQGCTVFVKDNVLQVGFSTDEGEGKRGKSSLVISTDSILGEEELRNKQNTKWISSTPAEKCDVIYNIYLKEIEKQKSWIRYLDEEVEFNFS